MLVSSFLDFFLERFQWYRRWTGDDWCRTRKEWVRKQFIAGSGEKIIAEECWYSAPEQKK